MLEILKKVVVLVGIHYMAASIVTVVNGTRSRKETVAEINNLAVIVPAMKTVSSAGTVVNDAGIPTPNAALTANIASAGTGLTGVYKYAASFYSTTEDSSGSPSSLGTVTLTNQRGSLTFANITNETANSRVNRLRLWRSLAGGTILFFLKDTSHTATSYVDSATDASISANDTLKVGTQAFSPPVTNTYGLVTRHGARLFMMGPADYYDYDSAYAGQAAWSNANSADAFPSSNVVDIGYGDNGGPIRAAAAQGDALVVYKERGIFLWMYRQDPDGLTGDGSIQRVVEERGTLTAKTVVNVDGTHFVMDQRGWYIYRGGQSIVDISSSIRPLLDRINWFERAQFSAAADEDRCYWFVALDDDTECKHAIVLDLEAFRQGKGVRWWMYFYPHGIRDCTAFVGGRTETDRSNSSSGRRQVALMTRYGTMFAIDASRRAILRDGFITDMGTGYATIATGAKVISAGASRTFTVSHRQFILGHSAVATSYVSARIAKQAGCFVKFYHPQVPDPQLITSMTSLTFTIETGLGFTLPANTTFEIGGISAYYKTPLMDFGNPHVKKSGINMRMEFEPRPITFPLNVQFIPDRRSIVTYGAALDKTGYEAATSSEYLSVDMGGNHTSHGRTGYIETPVGGIDFRYLQMKIFSSGVETPWQVNSISVLPRMWSVEK